MLDIINQTDFIKPPADFISCAKIFYDTSEEQFIPVSELKIIVESRAYWSDMGIVDVKVKLNVPLITKTVIKTTDFILG